MDLSAGQKQLLAFARVLARDPKILILDEATSNVDTETEMLIEQAIRAVMANRTSIIIAHRLSTIRRANQIIIIDRGRIVEQGTHEDLMEKAGLYHHLQMLQNGVSSQERRVTAHDAAADARASCFGTATDGSEPFANRCDPADELTWL